MKTITADQRERVTTDVCKLAFPPASYGKNLEEVERTIQEVVERIFRDPDGLLRSGVYGKTMKPLTEADVPDRPNGLGTHVECAGIPRRFKAVWLNYEDAGMASGKYLGAMLRKHAVTRDPRALGRARKTFRALERLWNHCAKKHPYGRGWMPKPYGGVRDVAEMFECSVDQYADITLGLDAFHRTVAAPRERQVIQQMILSFADWWIEHDYTAGYMGYCCYWKKLEYAHPIAFFLYLNALAYAYVPRKRYEDGFQLWLEISRGLSTPDRTVCISSNGLALECLERLLELRPARRDFWRLAARTCVENLLALSKQKHNYPGSRMTMQLKAFVARYLCVAHRLLPERGYDQMIGELLAAYRKRADFYHLSRGLRLKDIDPKVAGNDYRNTFWAEGHICWLSAYWTTRNWRKHA